MAIVASDYEKAAKKIIDACGMIEDSRFIDNVFDNTQLVLYLNFKL